MLMRQLALDLFGWKGAPPVSLPSPAPSPAPPAHHVTTSAAPDTAVARYAHPRANRRALLADVLVEYELRRSRRRTIGFAVGPDGLTVSAPHWTPLTEVDAALREKARWITTRLMQSRERAARLAAARIDWGMGAVVPYLGGQIVLMADPRAPQTLGSATLDPPDAAASALPGIHPPQARQTPQTLRLPLPPDATPTQWRDAAAAWLMRQARRLFTERLDHYAPQLGVRWQRLSLSSAQTRWGSASSGGWIRLNWRLIHFSLPVIDYVVVHELAHLREMNHSPRFWAHVAGAMPDYAERRASLREAVLPELGALDL